jgi:signal transduction histidine kinase
LNAILGFSEIIADQTFGSAGNTQYAEYARIIHQSGAHLLSLINDLLDLSKIEAGKMELHPEANDVAEIVTEALRLASARLGEQRGPEPRACLASGLPLLQADRRALLQMVVNLVSNARKFTPADGTVTVDARTNAAGGIVITVADTGIGIARDDIPKALAPFTQIDDGAARRHGGTGLGLPIVKSLIDIHGGELVLESDAGKGTRVSLIFPPASTVEKAA